MTERVLIDAGPLVAILNERDQYHARCKAQVEILRPPLLTCWPVVIEAAYLLRRSSASVAMLFEYFNAGVLQLLPLDQYDLPPILEIMRRYTNLQAQIADAALVHLAERENIESCFTLDRRDFSVYRIGGNRSFKIVP